MNVRCKFRCEEIVKRGERGRFLYVAKFGVVYDGDPENSKFFEATPYGDLEIGTFNADLFTLGKEYYVDLSEASAPETTGA